ncbi:hypothetical protein W02_24690 [Nitrospira sp. KM1]|uniref:MarR family winged helix-turn-helix transcriptional regulator n=1 Tax=Nitrospira sp. KM1 TaxID=1936990 RepID=UPI0013A763D4|nr:MarR family transcriptional regulator [Nitrospira sp. KM1]BCA55329.1 hypothetical protein W02_24690 [Nitrospira sp. KM1]
MGPQPTILEQILRLHAELRERLSQFRLTPLQAAVLLYLHRHPDVGTMRLAEALRLKAPTTTPVIQDLFRKRLITRSAPTRDGRARPVTLTNKGAVLIPQILKSIEGIRLEEAEPADEQETSWG